MCNPALVIMAIGTAVSVGGQIQQANTQSRIAEYNAEVQNNKAEEAKLAGLAAEDAHRAKVRQFIGAQAAQQGASGGVIGEGSGGMLMDEAAKFGAMDALTIRTNALKQAWGFEQEALSTRLEGQARKSAGYWSAGSTLLTSAGNIYMQGKKDGVWGK